MGVSKTTISQFLSSLSLNMESNADNNADNNWYKKL